MKIGMKINCWKLNGRNINGRNPIRAPKVPFNFHFKIENWKMIKICHFSITNFYCKIEKWKSVFHFSVSEFNCQVTLVVNRDSIFKNSLAEEISSFCSQKKKKNFLVAYLEETDLEIAMRRKSHLIHLVMPASKTHLFNCLCYQVVKCIWSILFDIQSFAQ